MSAKAKRRLKLIASLVFVVALVGGLLFTPLGSWAKTRPLGLWQGLVNLPGLIWLRQEMQGTSETAGPSSRGDSETIDAILEKGLVLQQEGAYEEALKRYREALDFDEAYAPTHEALADIYIDLGREEEALRELEQAASLAPDDSRLLTKLGMFYLRNDELDGAVGALSWAKEADPENPIVLHWLGVSESYRSHVDAQNAVDDLEKAAELAPTDPGVYFQLARAYVQRDDASDQERAVQAREEVLELDPSYVDAYYFLGQLYLGTGQREAAIAAWKEFVARSDDEETVAKVRTWLRDLAE